MKITDEAKTMLQDLLTKNGGDCLTAILQETCCGTSLMFNLAKTAEGDQPEMINDVPVLMTEEAKQRAEAVTLSVQNGELAVMDEAASDCC